tara:strand:+ start:848 stop:1255 length:408 start_codon:yes stop_codon:yes gene_type:complete
MASSQKDSQLKIIMSQTDYDEETAEKKLQYWNNDFIKVIKEFLNPRFQEKEKQIEKEKNKVVSVNQSIMKQLRQFKDKQNQQYDQYKKYRDYLKKEEELMELNKYLRQQEVLKQKMEKDKNKKLEKIEEVEEIIL